MSDGSLSVAKARFEVALHPALANDPQAGASELLGTLLLRYSEDLNGIVLAFSAPKILSQKALVQPYFPYIHIDATASVTLFNPVPDTRLVGTVTKIGRDFIGLLVAGIVNVTIPSDKIRSEFVSELMNARWASTKDGDHTISVGDSVVFDVVKSTRSGQFMSLIGSLKSSGTGNLKAAGVPANGEATNGKGSKKRKESSSTAEETDGKRKKKKSKS